jgi:multidrug transporter EmrE-like cation transporter
LTEESTAIREAAVSERRLRSAAERRKSILMVLGCTVLGAVAQVFIKLGANQLPTGSALTRILGMITSPPIVFGYSLYAAFTLLFIYALKREELSILYPIISLNYVWVTALSIIIFGEALNGYKVAGILAIMLGVSVLGRDGRQ